MGIKSTLSCKGEHGGAISKCVALTLLLPPRRRLLVPVRAVDRRASVDRRVNAHHATHLSYKFFFHPSIATHIGVSTL